MRKLKQNLESWLTQPGMRRMLAGLTFTAASVVTMVARAASPAHGGGHGAPHVNWWRWETGAPPVGWFILDFILFVVLIVYFAKKPVRAAFIARHERIKKAIHDACETHAQAKDRYEDYRGKLANVEAESAVHVERGKLDGAHERDQIVLAANEYAERLRTDAKAVIDQELAKAMARLQHQTATLLLQRTEQVLRTTLTDRDRERLLDEAIAAFEKKEAS